MRRTNRGFTIIEILFVVLIGGILIAVSLASIRNVTARFSARSARDTFLTLHARARVRAVERGVPAILFMDFANDSASVTQGSTLLETIHFRSEFNVDFTGPGAALILCMGARGIADSACTNFNTPQTIQFQFNDEVVGVQMLPLGQVLY